MIIKKRILVVDDEEIVRDVIRDLLELEGYNIIEAVNSKEAIAKAKKTPPDLIILDLIIPTIGGMEVCEILKKEEKTKFVPIIMLTGRIMEEDKLMGLEIGADDYITKPFLQGEFIARVKAVLRRVEYRENKNK